MTSPVQCAVCREKYDYQTRVARMLSCGHTFCQICLGKTLVGKTCPRCRTKVLVLTGAEGIPINFDLLAIVADPPTAEELLQQINEILVTTTTNVKAVEAAIDKVNVAVDNMKLSYEEVKGQIINSFKELRVSLDAWMNESCQPSVSVPAELSNSSTCDETEKLLVRNMQQGARAALIFREQELLGELEGLYNANDVILSEQLNRLLTYRDLLKNSADHIMSTMQTPDNDQLLILKHRREGMLADLQNQQPVLEPKAEFAPKFTIEGVNDMWMMYFDGRMVARMQTIGALSEKPTTASGFASPENKRYTSAITTTASGTGLSCTALGDEASFLITARDVQGCRRRVGGDSFLVNLGEEDSKVTGKVKDKGDGTYIVTYTIPADADRGDYLCSVRFLGTHIQGSPFTVRVEHPDGSSPLPMRDPT